jgi:predicted metal-binding membrane protein
VRPGGRKRPTRLSSTARSAAASAAPAPSGARPALLWPLLALLVAAAWAVLWFWSASPYGRYLDHGGWGDLAAFAALCRAVPKGEVVVPALLHAAAWVLMVAAMMLPTTAPLLAMFRRLTRARPDSSRLLGLVLLGFLAAWLAFGVAAHLADALLRWAATRYDWFVVNGWIVGAVVIAGAGLFQWSALKYRCLEACRTPFGFVSARWHGRSPGREAFRIGVDHGVFCVGCCWALMLVMFVVGMGSLGWMLALAAVMAAEKNLPFGRYLRTPVGLGLLAGAAAIVVANT